MIELTQQQAKALDAPQQPPVAVDPRTGQEYLLIKREIYEKVKKTRSVHHLLRMQRSHSCECGYKVCCGISRTRTVAVLRTRLRESGKSSVQSILC
jgi:hypothetical protein